jgi:hypothetical protein
VTDAKRAVCATVASPKAGRLVGDASLAAAHSGRKWSDFSGLSRVGAKEFDLVAGVADGSV